MSIFFHPRMLAYDFGALHVWKPERLELAMEILGHYGMEPVDPGEGKVEDVLRVHDASYVEALQNMEAKGKVGKEEYGIGTGDNPFFPSLWSSSLAVVAGSAAAARAVCDGTRLGVNLSGGLHHARKSSASGFCILNDCAVAISVLREKFAKVAYVDIDVHHGDGVQGLFYDDPTVLTCSIHQDGRTIYPGTGAVEETGAEFSSANLPLWPGTTGDIWLAAFQQTLIPTLQRFQPEAIVLQLGADAHATDRLGQLQLTTQEWLGAVKMVRELGLPTVALGGGGYTLKNVPRMWAAATLELMGKSYSDRLPEPIARKLGAPTFSDDRLPMPRRQGQAEAFEQVSEFRKLFGLQHLG
jgi:acetoin utilization protein AcuC